MALGGLCCRAQFHNLENEQVSILETDPNQAAGIVFGRKGHLYTIET